MDSKYSNSYLDSIYYINLDKDTDRRASIITQIDKIGAGIKRERIPGIMYSKDGCPEDLKKYMHSLSYFLSKSAIGCGLSHIKTWENIVKNKDNYALILEDDAIIDDDFNRLTNEWIKVIPDDFDMIFLGCSIGCESDKKYSAFYSLMRLGNLNNIVKVRKISDNVFVPSLPVDLHGYILSHKCAKKFLDIFEKNKLNSHIDIQLLNYYKYLKVYAFNKKLINQQLKTSLSSNNTTSYPVLLTKIASKIKGSDGADLSYQLSIHGIELLGVGVNLWVGLMFIFGMSFKDAKSLTAAFFSYNLLEIVYSKKIEITHILIYYVFCLLGLLIRINLFKM